VRGGLIAVAATGGVLVAYGLRAHSLSAPFLFLGLHLGGFRQGMYPQSTIVLAGFLLHAAWIVAWCVTFALVGLASRGWTRALLVAATVTLSYLATVNLMGSALASSSIGGSRWVFLHIVFAIAIHMGTRLALPRT
jgi:hypothetical protein